MGSSISRTELTYSYTDEPHATRRKLILQKYPQVKKLMGVDDAFKWQVLALVSAQLFSFYFVKNTTNPWLLFALAYCIGGVANHAIMLAIHEISHGMGFGPSKPTANKLLSILANLPLGIPMSISFKKYHLEHHRYQGDVILDTDVPTLFEASFFTSSMRKFCWCVLQPFFYTIRPLFVNPKPLDKYEVLNILVQLAFDLLIVTTFGWHVLAYMVGGSILAMGLHPVAGHFISEHTLMFEKKTKSVINNGSADSDTNNNVDNMSSGSPTKTQEDVEKSMQVANGDTNGYKGLSDKLNSTVDENGDFLIPETCSYYGPLNWVTFNVGYHVEHHDFPSIPGSRLHMLSKIAPEFYLNLNHHKSWTYVLWRYITDPKLGPSARVRRPHLERKQA